MHRVSLGSRTNTRPLLLRQPSRGRVVVVAKQYVPSDSFGGVSPERAGSRALRNLFTFIAARIVLSQLEGSGRGSLAAYDAAAYNDLLDFLQTEKMVDCDEWLAQLKRKNSGLALRLMEVRSAYANEDFEWDNLKKLTLQDLQLGNVKIMRKAAAESLNAALSAEPARTPSRDTGDSSSSDSNTSTTKPPGPPSPPSSSSSSSGPSPSA